MKSRLEQVYPILPLIVLLLLVVGLMGTSVNGQAELVKAVAPEKKVNVKIQVLQPETFAEFGSFLGEVRGIKQTTLFAPVGGIVNALKVKDGDIVEQGSSLCDIDGKKMRLMRESAKMAEKIAGDATTRLSRHQAKGSGSQLQVEKAKQALIQAQIARLGAVQNFEGAMCISPFKGVVISHHFEPFQRLPPMARTFTLADIDQVSIFVAVPENQIDGYRVGSQVSIKGIHGQQNLSGHIYSISQGIDKNSRNYRVEVHAANEGHFLKPGNSVWLQIQRRSEQMKVVIPRSAIITLQHSQVVMVAEGGVAKRRVIKVDATNDTQALIKSGVNLGEKLIVDGHTQASDGALVQVIK